MTMIRTLMMTGLLAALATPALAGPGDAHHDMEGGAFARLDGEPSDAMLQHLARAAQELELDATQKENIQAILEQAREDLAATQEAGKDNRKQLHELLTADTLDEEQLAQTAGTSGDLLAERIVITAQAAHSALSQLTEEQRAELRTMREAHMGRMHERHESRDDA